MRLPVEVRKKKTLQMGKSKVFTRGKKKEIGISKNYLDNHPFSKYYVTCKLYKTLRQLKNLLVSYSCGGIRYRLSLEASFYPRRKRTHRGQYIVFGEWLP